MDFKLIEGVTMGEAALKNVRSAYVPFEGGLDSILSAEFILPFLRDGVKLLPEPHFFFMELPCTEDEEKELRKQKSDPLHYKVYYLDGCTEPVSQAIIKRYGALLVNDGLVRFGFGSNKTNEEIYVSYYQQVTVYSENTRFEELFIKQGACKGKTLVTPWDNFSEDNVGISMAVEIEGESCEDIVSRLTKEGMYLAEMREI